MEVSDLFWLLGLKCLGVFKWGGSDLESSEKMLGEFE